MAIKILSSENITGKLTLSGQQELLELTRGGASDSKWFFSADSAKLYIAEDTSASSDIKMTLTDTGNVGIGTLTPSGKLSVTGTGIAAAPTFDVINTSTNQFNHSGEAMAPNMTTGQNNIFVIGVASSTLSSGYIGYKYSGTAGSNANVLTFGHWGSDNLMNIDGLGNVGIGTTSPDEKLDITGGYLKFNGGDYGLKGSASLTYNPVSDHYFQSSGTEKLRIASTGIVYIMGATPSVNNSLQLQYNSTAGTAEIYSKSTGGSTSFEFYTSSSGTTTPKFTIGSSGDVRITTNGKFLQGIRNTGSAAIDMIGFGAGTDRLQIKGGTSGGAESIAFFDTAGQMATFYNSCFGIGTTSPNAKLEVITSTAGYASIIRNTNGANDSNGLLVKAGTGATEYALKVSNTNDTTNFMVVKGDGNVGIGTTSPTGYKLVIQNTAEDMIKLHNSTDGLDSLISFTNPGGTLARIQGLDNGGLQFDTGNNAGGLNTNVMYMSNIGNVGIGGSPSVNFEIAKAGARIKMIDGTNQLNMGLWDGANYRFEGDANRPMFFTSYQGNINFGISGGTTMTVQSGGVGIGITNPSEKLHVNGRTILQNTEYVDYATGSLDTTGVVMATVPASTNGQSLLLTFEATGGTGSVYSVIYSCYNGGGNWYYTKNVLIFGGNIEVAETNGSGSSTLSFSFRATSSSAAYTPRVVMKGSPYGLVSFI